MKHYAFVYGFLAILLGYSMISSCFQYLFYVNWAKHKDRWKIQPLNDESLSEISTWIPMLSKTTLKKKRAKNHKLLASVNLLIASIFSGLTFQAIFDERSKVSLHNNSFIGIVLYLIVIIVIHCIQEYYLHRLMHIGEFCLEIVKKCKKELMDANDLFI